MFSLVQQIIEGCRIGEFRIFSHRSIVALFFSIGFKGGCVKGHQRCPAGLGSRHPFDPPVDPGDLGPFPGDQADSLRSRSHSLQALFPGLSDPWILLGIVHSHDKDQIPSICDLLPFFPYYRILFRVLRIPGLKKQTDGMGHSAPDPVQKLQMPFP